MCPLCITAAALSAAGAASGAGVIAVAASRWRTVQRWFMQKACRLRSSVRLRALRNSKHSTTRASQPAGDEEQEHLANESGNRTPKGQQVQ
jgi:hypothetical protein